MCYNLNKYKAFNFTFYKKINFFVPHNTKKNSKKLKCKN